MKKPNDKTLLEKELKNLALNFEGKIVKRLVEKGFNRYNVFDVLNINRQELRHSDFLAFLLDSSTNGDIGTKFLKRFLLSEEIVGKFDFTQILYGNIENVVIGREVATVNGRIDILIEFELTQTKKQKYVVAIENKIDSTEHDEQLSRYRTFLSQGRYLDYEKILLYLTIDKEEPRDAEWIAIDYGTVYKSLEQLDTANTDKTVALLINDYKEILRREFIMSDDELKALAREIYSENKLVLDFIYQNLPDWTDTAAPIVHEFLRSKGFRPQNAKQKVNIMFRIDVVDGRRIDERYWFQINLRDLSMYFVDRNLNWKTVSPQKWLVGNSKADSLNTAAEYAELAIKDPERLKHEFRNTLELAFADGTLIKNCVADIDKYEQKIKNKV